MMKAKKESFLGSITLQWFLQRLFPTLLLPNHLPFLQVLWSVPFVGRFLICKQMELWLQNANETSLCYFLQEPFG